MLAPTGTIAFLMDCDTTGVEPDIALVKYKLLAGGGMLKIVNRGVPDALRRLGYDAATVTQIIAHIEKHDTIEDVEIEGTTISSGLKAEHLPVFDCAFKPHQGKRSIGYMAHLKMMGAAQPFISGAISKTVSMPNECTVAEVRDTYVQAWKMGLKCVAIYRDGSKRSQPLNTKKTNEGANKTAAPTAADSVALETRLIELEAEVLRLRAEAGKPLRRRLSDTRQALTHKFDIAGHEGYLTVGLFEDGRPGELFITMAKEGSTVSGLMDSFALAVSISLQHGVPLKLFCEKFAHTRFEPSGWTNNPEIGFAKSIMDYIFRWLQLRFLTGQQQMLFENLRLKAGGAPHAAPSAEGVGDLHGSSQPRDPRSGSVHASDALSSMVDLGDAPSCHYCGAIMTRNGSCYRCMSCGSTSGCS